MFDIHTFIQVVQGEPSLWEKVCEDYVLYYRHILFLQKINKRYAKDRNNSSKTRKYRWFANFLPMAILYWVVT